jgi:hypothetical protein
MQIARATTRAGVILAGAILATGVAVSFGAGGDAPDGDQVGPKGPAELILGTWTLVEWDGARMPWYSSSRIEYRADGTYVVSNNNNLLRIRVRRGVGQYRVEGNTIHGAITPEPDDSRLNQPGYVQPDGLRHWKVTIVELTDTRLSIAATDPSDRQVMTYRRVR